jgi:PTS system nitrogen regulatory IIA component
MRLTLRRPADESNAMKISDCLTLTDVMIDIGAADKQKLLLELARKAGTVLDVLPQRVFTEVCKREELGSTGMGGGVAIPHARVHQVSKPLGMLVRLRKPIDFEAVDGQPVDLVFMLLLPEGAEGEQLGALALIARKLRNPAIAAALRGAHNRAEMYRALVAD